MIFGKKGVLITQYASPNMDQNFCEFYIKAPCTATDCIHGQQISQQKMVSIHFPTYLFLQ